MYQFPEAMKKLIRELSKLPSVGEKTASRLAYHIISNDRELAKSLSASLLESIEKISFCKNCFNLSDGDFCSICKDTTRDKNLLCVVEKPVDVIAFERMGEYKGMYHVLHGLWAPLKGLGPEGMKLKELFERIKKDNVKEVILATSSTVEGDATSLLIADRLKDMKIKATRLAQGMSKGAELEFADDVTLSRAFTNRFDF